ncbi:MAG: TSUP family transporter [bacterium]|nr:TSUP family transporter [bacterium]
MAAGFEISALSLILVCLLVFLAGFVDASAGGGGIISLPAYIFTGMPAHFALGCNKFSSSCGTTLAVFKFWRGGAVNIRAAALAAAGSFIGSAVGAKTALALSDQTLKTMLLVILPCAAVIIFLKRNLGDCDRSAEVDRGRAAALAFLIGLLIGGYDGLFGPGTGTFAIIAFSVLMKFDLKTASGNAKILNLASNYASLMTFAFAGTILYGVALPAALCGIAGNYLGAQCALTKGARFIRPMMLTVLALLMLKLLWDILT